MAKNISAQTLLEYKILNLPSNVSSSLEQDEVKLNAKIEQFLETVTNEPVELRGEAPLFFVLKVLSKLKNMATELMYRPTSQEPGVIIFSLLEPEKFLHPHDVELSIVWAEAELKKFEKKQKVDTEKNIVIHLYDWWQAAKQASPENPLKSMLEILYNQSPHKNTVRIQGICPILPALIVANWFIGGATEVRYGELVLK